MVAQTLTPNSQDDSGQVEPLLGHVEVPVDRLGGDGARTNARSSTPWPRPSGAAHLADYWYLNHRRQGPKSSAGFHAT